MAFRAPLLGYNTNVRHKGKLYHIQTEDSGISRPHVVTHLFADGGRIVASKKTSYAQHVGMDKLQELVKKLMQAQHKAMFIALRDGAYDEEGPLTTDGPAVSLAPAATPDESQERPALRGATAQSAQAAPREVPPVPSARHREGTLPLPSTRQREAPPPLPSARQIVHKPIRDDLYQSTQPANQVVERAHTPSSPRERVSIFGSDLLSEKSLDEVVLSYLASDEDS